MPRKPTPGDGIYHAILLVMVATVVLGAVLAIGGETILHDPGVSRLGTVMALLGAAIYAAFRVLGAREPKRRDRRERTGDDGPGPGSP
jgi:hypothetical protein